MGCRDAKTVQEALRIAASYRVGAKLERRILAFYSKYKPWIEKYRGGWSGLGAASGIIHESNGNPLSTSDPKLEESGLWSLTRGVSEKLNIDPFDPEANIWAAARQRNERIKKSLELYPWLARAVPYQYTKMMSMQGSIGFPGWKLIMKKVFPKPPTGTTLRYPYDHMREWIVQNGDKLAMGRMSAPLVVCRLMRTFGADWLKKKGDLFKPGYYKLIPRPSHLPRFNAAVYQAIWKTPLKQRADKFARYLKKVPAAEAGGVLAALALTGGGGYLLWRYIRRHNR